MGRRPETDEEREARWAEPAAWVALERHAWWNTIGRGHGCAARRLGARGGETTMAYHPPEDESRRKAYDEGYRAARDGLSPESRPDEPSGLGRDTTPADDDRQAWSDGFVDHEGDSISRDFRVVVVTDAMVDAAIREAQSCRILPTPWLRLDDRDDIRKIIGAALAAGKEGRS